MPVIVWDQGFDEQMGAYPQGIDAIAEEGKHHSLLSLKYHIGSGWFLEP